MTEKPHALNSLLRVQNRLELSYFSGAEIKIAQLLRKVICHFPGEGDLRDPLLINPWRLENKSSQSWASN